MPAPMIYPRLLNVERQEFDERDAFEMQQNGCVRVIVEFQGGGQYILTFFNLARLAQELQRHIEMGEPCFAQANLMVVPDVTVEAMQASVKFLLREGFFEGLSQQ